MNGWFIIFASLILSAPFALIALSIHRLTAAYNAMGRAAREVRAEMGEDWSDEPIESGLFHPTYEATSESFARRAQAERRELFDPTADWGNESIFDIPMYDEQPTGVYHDGS